MYVRRIRDLREDHDKTQQEIADMLVSLGIKYIWNFANVSLQVPPHVVVQREVIAGGLAMLSVKRKQDQEVHNQF